MVRLFRSVLMAAVLLSAAAGSAVAQTQAGTVQNIIVEGNKRIEPDTIRSYLAINEGAPFDDDKIDQSLKTLFATGLFADVSIHRQGDALVVKVVENPLINRIAFEGNRRIKSDQLQSEIQLKPRTVYTRTKVQGDVKRILDIYRRNGRFAATVDPKLIKLDQNRVDLVFEIHEGTPTYIERIDFVGNKRYSDSALREILQTKEERWYRFFTSDDTYDPDRVNYDRELLRRFYLKNGFADFRVVSAVAELTPNRSGFFLTFTIEEGERYKVGKVAVRSAIPDLKESELTPLITFESGDWYNADEVENTIQAITDAAGNKSYAFVDVKPMVERNRAKKTVDVTFDVLEGPHVYVERIDIQGNVRTLDKVIRREFRLVEGDAFNAAKLRRSRQRIRDLNFFEKVEVNSVPSETAPDRTVIKVDVQEKSTGELSVGTGWSTSVGALVTAGVRERNLLGRGQDVSINGMLGQKRTSIMGSFTEPYFMDRHLSAGIDLFALSTDNTSESSYQAKIHGATLRTGWFYNEHLSHSFHYTISQTDITDITSDASRYIQDQAGMSTVSLVGHNLAWDHRDSKIDPTSGWIIKVGNEVAGLGGTEKFIRSSASAQKYFALGEKETISLSATGGYIHELGREVRINQRYFLGGDTLRGFADAGISPRDHGTGDALGSLWYWVSSVEYTFPTFLPKELGVQGKLFTDVGSTGPTVNSIDKSTIDDSRRIRASVGTGLIWRSPMGPINVDLAVPVLKDSSDNEEIFRINFGTRF